MRVKTVVLLLCFMPLSLLLFPASASAQAMASGSPLYGTTDSRLDLGLGYQRIQANAPPGLCQCFGANGGFVNANWWLFPHLGITADVTGTHANDISSLGQNLTLMTFMAGPHGVIPIHRLSFFWEFLAGAAHGSNSYFPTSTGYETSATSFAFAPGGGVDFDLTDRWSIRVVQARYLHSSLPNGTSSEQNELMIGAGIVFHLGSRSHEPKPVSEPPAPVSEAVAPPPPPPPAPQLTNFSCTAAATEIQAGTTLEVASLASTSPVDLPVTMQWSTSGGSVLGSGPRVTVDTSSLPPGEYHVTGHAQLGNNTDTLRSCDVVFHVSAPPPPPPTPEDRVRDFRAHVHDVYFDLNKSALRPDALATLRDNAGYLQAHPEIRIIVQGYADERGSSRYNLALGERRVQSVHDELLRLGISADRMQVLTFGHDAQTCTTANEQCWQKNRRVGFLMQP